MFKRVIATIFVGGLLFSSIAQNVEGLNARLDAMGGSNLPDDIGFCLYSPSTIMGFNNYLQGSLIIKALSGQGETYGVITGIKSINDRISLGLNLNQYRRTSSSFFKNGAIAQKGAFELNIGDNLEYIPRLPVVNFGMKITDDIKIGAALFGDVTHYKKTLKTDPEDSNIDSTSEKGIYNIGGVLDARIGVGPITLAPRIILSTPKIRGLEKNEGANEYKYEYSSEKSLDLNLQLMAWTDIGKTWSIAGIWLDKEKYQFNKHSEITADETNCDSLGYEYDVTSVDWFFGFTPSFGDGFFFGPEYDGGYFKVEKIASDTLKKAALDDDDVNADHAHDSTWSAVYHTVRIGIEKEFHGRFLDTWAVRGGLAYKYMGKPRLKIVDANNATVYEELKVDPAKTGYDEFEGAKGTKITLGCGFVKGRFTLDMSMDALSWKSGLFNGPAAAMVTVGVDIGKRSKSSRASSVDDAPSYEPPAPSSQNTDEPADDDFGGDLEF